MEDTNEKTNKSINGINGYLKGSKLFDATLGCNYKIKISDTATTAVNVYDKVAKKYVIRIDNPHKGIDFSHININNKISGFPDPHLPLPPGGVPAAKGLAKTLKVLNTLNEVAIPITIAVDVAQTGYAVYKDIQNGTSRKTVETVGRVAGGWAGGFGGATGGAAIGTLALPGIGTLIGGIVGAISGGVGGALGASAIVDVIGDATEYNTIEKWCDICGIKFVVRLYKGEKDIVLCLECRKSQSKL